MGGPVASELDRTLDRAARRLISLQEPDGWWVGELESNVTMTAQQAKSYTESGSPGGMSTSSGGICGISSQGQRPKRASHILVNTRAPPMPPRSSQKRRAPPRRSSSTESPARRSAAYDSSVAARSGSPSQ